MCHGDTEAEKIEQDFFFCKLRTLDFIPNLLNWNGSIYNFRNRTIRNSFRYFFRSLTEYNSCVKSGRQIVKHVKLYALDFLWSLKTFFDGLCNLPSVHSWLFQLHGSGSTSLQIQYGTTCTRVTGLKVSWKTYCSSFLKIKVKKTRVGHALTGTITNN